MSTDIKRARGTTEAPKDESPDPAPVVRLSVNLAPSVADALKAAAANQGITVTEATRRAIALLKLADDAKQSGSRLMVVEGQGANAQYREIVMI